MMLPSCFLFKNILSQIEIKMLDLETFVYVGERCFIRVWRQILFTPIRSQKMGKAAIKSIFF